MKHLKLLGLAVAAAAALMAFAGADTASATFTSLCKVKETVGGEPRCEGINKYPEVTPVHAELEAGASFLLQTLFGNVKCNESTLEVVTAQKTEIPLGTIVTALSFGECTGRVEPSNVGALDIELIDLPAWTHNGTLTFTETEVTVEQSGVHCVYSLAEAGTLTGGEMATIDLGGAWTRSGGRSGPFCGKTANASGNYTVTSPEPLWVSM